MPEFCDGRHVEKTYTFRAVTRATAAARGRPAAFYLRAHRNL